MGSVATATRRWGLGLMIALGVALSGASGYAQTPEELAAAREVFKEGKELEKRNAWGDALEKFKKVAAIKMTPPVRFHIALCEENLGKLVSAINGFELAAQEAHQGGPAAAEVADKAPERAEALRKRIAKLKIDVAGKVFQSKVILDGAALQSASFGAAMPVDPGAHVVEVQDGSGKTTFRKELTLAERAEEQVSVEINDVEPQRPPPAPPTAQPTSAAPPPPLRPPPSRAPAYVVGGVGAAVLAGSGAFFILKTLAISEAEGHCHPPGTPNNCDLAAKPAIARVKTYDTLSSVFFGVGLAGLATAGVLWFALGPKKPAPLKSAIVVVPLGPGLAIRGVF